MDSYNLHLYNKRLEKGMKIKEFSKFLHINKVTYKCIEDGYLKPTKKQIGKISKALGEDFAPYLEGDCSYPAAIPIVENKIVSKFYEILGKKVTKIIIGVLIAGGLATLGSGFYVGNQAKNNVRSYYSTEYVEFYDQVKEKGTPTLSLTSDLVIPEIFSKEDNKFYSIKGSFDEQAMNLMSAVVTYHTDEYRLSYLFSLNTNPLSLIANYVEYSTGYVYKYYYDEPTKDNYEFTSFYDSSLKLDDTTTEGKEKIEKMKVILESNLSEINTEFDNIIETKTGLNYKFYEGFANDYRIGNKANSRSSTIALVLLLLGTLSSAGCLFFLIFAFLYGRKHGEKLQNNGDNCACFAREPHAKKDIFITPVIPETVYEIAGIILVFFGSIRILYYVFTFLGVVSISGNDFTTIPNTLFYLFMIGMFLLYFMDFDIFIDDKRVIRNIFLYFIVYVCLYVIETLIMTSLMESKNLIVQEIALNATIPNNFGTITCYFIMTMTLFSRPKFIKTNKGILILRLLTIIPIAIIVTNTLIYNYANSIWGWNLSVPVLYLFSSEKIQFSLLCIIYLLGLFIFKTLMEKKYGADKTKILMNGNKALFIKNGIGAVTVFIIGLLELLLSKNNYALTLGLGKFPNLMYIAPALLLYHPHMGARNVKFDWAIDILYIISFGGIYIILGAILVISLLSSL